VGYKPQSSRVHAAKPGAAASVPAAAQAPCPSAKKNSNQGEKLTNHPHKRLELECFSFKEMLNKSPFL
jgi:hypothetical protein